MDHSLKLQNKILQNSYRQKIEELKLNKGKSLFPSVIELDPTTACNLACHDCISANLLNQGGFERERLKDLAREFKDIGIKAVILIGGGEPMAHPEFGTIVDYLSDNGIHVGVTSNGTLIKKFFKPLSKCKWIRISMDSGTSEVYQKYRPHKSGVSQFDSVINQMKDLRKIYLNKLGYSFLILSKNNDDGTFETNATDIENAAYVAKEIGCNYFEVKPSFDMMHFLQSHSQDTIRIVNDQLSKIRKIQDDSFSIISPGTLGDSLTGKLIQEKKYDRCLVAEMRTVISPSGTYVCPYHRGNLNMKIGDANKTNLKDIWKSEKRNEVMKKLNPKKHCTFHCIRNDTNNLLEELMLKNKIDFTEDYDLFM